MKEVPLTGLSFAIISHYVTDGSKYLVQNVSVFQKGLLARTYQDLNPFLL